MVDRGAVRVGPADWLTVVSQNLRAGHACLSVSEPVVTAAAYHCQQTAEKLVKAVLVSFGLDVPKTHDIDALLMRLPPGLALRPSLEPLARFTAFATLYRYPGESSDVSDEPTAEEVASWLADIESVRDHVIEFLRSPP